MVSGSVCALAGSDRPGDQVEARVEAPGEPVAPAPPAIRELVAERSFRALAARVSSFAEFTAAIAELPGPDRISAINAWVARSGASFVAAEAKAIALTDAGRAEDAIALLLDSAALVSGPDTQARFEAVLTAAVDAEARRLTAAERLTELDALYERIAFALPELGVYFLKLGTLRVKAGDEDGALAVLSQIQNHPQYGEAARSLLVDVSVPRSAENEAESESLETVSLSRRGDQFIVDAVIDDGRDVSLLIDTGSVDDDHRGTASSKRSVIRSRVRRPIFRRPAASWRGPSSQSRGWRWAAPTFASYRWGCYPRSSLSISTDCSA
ncbi:MAG: hypothetical protein U5O39_15555 [Gammaproteobacteria bacterium]|nr:hypothetical protein [Gammaproteobacteria bacterium]